MNTLNVSWSSCSVWVRCISAKKGMTEVQLENSVIKVNRQVVSRGSRVVSTKSVLFGINLIFGFL